MTPDEKREQIRRIIAGKPLYDAFIILFQDIVCSLVGKK
jgi:hypothetical protein